MSYHYLEDIATADVAFEAKGESLAELFTAAADAVMNTMVEDLESIKKREELEFTVQHEELDMLLFNFLQELIFFKDARRLLLRILSVAIDTTASGYKLQAVAGGEELDPEKHNLIVDVKAVTLYRFAVEQTVDGWTATVILDI